MVKARRQLAQTVGPQKCDKPKSTYNIWYNKYTGDRHKPGEAREKASTRCKITTDAGETRGTNRDDAGICLNFARGCCPLGFECSWIHEIPDAKFNVKQETMRDCFFRERHSEVRDDQSGVGSFNTDDETSRTVYVGGIACSKDMKSIVYKHFSEWGEIENMRLLEHKGVAFVRYKLRGSAEFAMEAMQRQSLDDNEVLNIRWATKDPNPWVEKRKRKADERMYLEAAGRQIDVHNLPKRCHTSHSSSVVGSYPNTDFQYSSHALDSIPTGVWQNSDISEFSLRWHCQNPAQGGHHGADARPQTLEELVAWSKRQTGGSTSTSEVKNSKKTSNEQVKDRNDKESGRSGLASIVGAYDSLSEDEADD